MGLVVLGICAATLLGMREIPSVRKESQISLFQGEEMGGKCTLVEGIPCAVQGRRRRDLERGLVIAETPSIELDDVLHDMLRRS